MPATHDQHSHDQPTHDEHSHEPADHRRLGRALRLFATDPLVGSGLPLWLPDGAVIRSELHRLAAQEAVQGGCQQVYTPVLAKRELFERSGHWAKFSDDMFPPMIIGGEQFVLRPANCPHHVLVYAAEQRSFRDLPLRLAELGSMFRSELSGVLGGLSRVRQINLDDTHVFCAPGQVRDEVARSLDAVGRCYRLLGIEPARYRLSRRGQSRDYLGGDDLWADAEGHLGDALGKAGLDYEDAPGEAAFYGPKIDIQVADPAGREETLSTIQVDFNLPERFDLCFTGSDGHPHRPVMIHRGVLSSMERLVAHLIEHYDGAFPPWLSAVQVIVVPVAEQHAGLARGLAQRIRAAGLRAECDPADATLGARIRRARERRIPYVAVIGDREAASWPDGAPAPDESGQRQSEYGQCQLAAAEGGGRVALRLRDGRRLDITADQLIAEISRQATERSCDLGFR
jgi:threonyl-tRNA synthetase